MLPDGLPTGCPCGCTGGSDCKRHEPIEGRGQRYAQSQRFLAASPYPKRRRTGAPKPGSKPGAIVVLHVTEDPETGKALIRGRGVPAVLSVAGKFDQAEWSPGAKGYVVPIDALPDVAAATDYLNGSFRMKKVDR